MIDFQLVAIAMGDVTWISLAFLFGYLATLIRLPPLVGFLATGFLLNYFGASGGEALLKLADLGITLLLFSVGLKLNVKILARPQVWSVTLLHIGIIVTIFSAIIYYLAMQNLPLFSGLDLKLSVLLAFAFSFSSTVFVVKILEEKGEMSSLHGNLAIGILVMQDLAAVIFLAASAGQLPYLWALLLFLLIPFKTLLHKLLKRTGHGELLILYGFVLALGGAELFDLCGVKDDLGALVVGVLISSHPKAGEMARAMLGFKDLFLVGFFLSIGMTGHLTQEALLIGVMLVPFIFVKSGLFFILMTCFKLRARTSLLTTLNLTNYSEFGLIVIAIGVSNNWIDPQWLVVMAIAASLSFLISAPLNYIDDKLYNRYRRCWMAFQKDKRLSDDGLLDTLGATIAVFGMGRVGCGAYLRMRAIHGEDKVVGIDFDAEIVHQHQSIGCHILQGDPSDADFWEKIDFGRNIDHVMLALPNLQANLKALEQLQKIAFEGSVSAIAQFPDEERKLRQAGATAVFNIFTEAGAGFAEHAENRLHHIR